MSARRGNVPRGTRRPAEDWRYDSTVERARARLRVAAAVVLLVVLVGLVVGDGLRVLMRPLTSALAELSHAPPPR
jgi:hypothetical protein